MQSRTSALKVSVLVTPVTAQLRRSALGGQPSSLSSEEGGALFRRGSGGSTSPRRIRSACEQRRIYSEGLTNFRWSALGCIDPFDSERRLILQRFSRSTRWSHLRTAPDSKISEKSLDLLPICHLWVQILPNKCGKTIFTFVQQCLRIFSEFLHNLTNFDELRRILSNFVNIRHNFVKN